MWTASFIPGYLWNSAPKHLKKLAEFENQLECQNYFMQLLNLSVETYKWQNLPDTCDERFLELMLNLNGWACLKKDENGIMSLGFLPKEWNIYGQPTKGSAYGFFGGIYDCNCYTKGAPEDGVNTVVCRCNTLNYPILNYIRIISQRLADTIRSMDVIRKQMKSPFIVQCDETQVPTVEKIFNKTQENEVYIVGSNMLQRESFQVVNTNVQGQNIEILQQYFDNTLNAFLRIIGIKGASNTDKKERLIVPEATSEFAITNDYINEGLHVRKEFTENCNKLFGTNISVDVNDSREYLVGNELYNMQDDMEENEDEIQ